MLLSTCSISIGLQKYFGPKFVYLKVLANNLVDSLSYLDTESKVTYALCHLESEDVIFKNLNGIEQAKMFDSLADEEIANIAFPLNAQVIAYK